VGGFGSGRQGGRPVVSQCLGLDANRLNRVGCIELSWRGTLQWERSGETIGSIRLASEAGWVRLTCQATSGTDPLATSRIDPRIGVGAVARGGREGLSR
jgi:hypothetical protein